MKHMASHSEDPSKPTLLGNVKVTRQDWLTAAIEMLVVNGVEQVKVLTLADRLNVSRSSFYWYFANRDDLLAGLLSHWDQKNTGALVTQAEASAKSIAEACCNVFRCFVNPALFDTALDFAIRDWARRDEQVRLALDASDARRLDALLAMFARHGYEDPDALVRARTLYYMQIGYIDADLKEPMEERLRLNPYYIQTFTGRPAGAEELDAFRSYVEALRNGETV